MRKLLFLFFLASSVAVFGQSKSKLLSATEPEQEQKAPISAYLDVAYAFKNHPWTSITKKELAGRLQTKALEIEHVKEEIALLKQEIILLNEYSNKLRPFHIELQSDISLGPLPPGIEERRDAERIIRELAFGGAEIRFNSPIDAYSLLLEMEKEISQSMEKVKTKEFYIEQQRTITKEKIKQAEDTEVNDILQDIYSELKTYCMKRNIAMVVNKNDILFGQKPVDITADFVDRLQKTRKSKDRDKAKKQKMKDLKEKIVVELDADAPVAGTPAPEIPAQPQAASTEEKQ